MFTRFLILGLFSTLLDYFFYSVLIFFNIHYSLAILFGYSTGFFFNFYIGKYFVFQAGTKTKNSTHEFISVAIITCIGLLLSVFIVWLLSDSLFHLSLLISRLIAIIMIFFWNYFARKYFVYH